VFDETKRSNLRRRGGAGFVTGMKSQLCRDAKGREHYMVCNAEEGEPGTFKDRVLLSRHPGMAFEGMTIGALTVGARHGMLDSRGVYRYLLEPLPGALQRRRNAHLPGTPIQGQPGFDFLTSRFTSVPAPMCAEKRRR
jgi:[NiFe] hydrogenase diaphorase moiety large subunit